MDGSFPIKPNAAVPKFTSRDRSPARPVETELDAAKSVTAAGDGGNEQRERRPDHAPHDVVVDPESREVINRENDVRAQSAEREHPDQALLRYRAYRPARSESDNTPPPSPTPTSRPEAVMPSLPLPQGKPLDVPRTIQQALELHHQGRIAEAERLYAAVLAARPDHFDALQMLGVIKLARGDCGDGAASGVGGDAVAAEVAAGAFEPRPRAQRHEPPPGGAGELRRGAQAQGPLRRGAQQPRQRADRARTQRRGARQLQARHRHQARLCGSVLQPGQRASRSSTATTTRSRATTAPSRCGPTTPRRTATAARCWTSSAGRPTRWLCYDRALAIAARFRRGDAQPLRRAARAQAHRRNAARPRPAADASIRTMPRRTTCAAC